MTMAPELLLSDGTNLSYCDKADLWSVGVVFYQLLYGTLPFNASSMNALKLSVKKDSGPNLKFLPDVEISPEAKDLLIKLITLDPKQRLSWQEAFNHPLFSKYEHQEVNNARNLFGGLGANQSVLAQKQFNENKGKDDIKKDVLPEEDF